MIYDHLDRIADYRNLGPRFGAAIDWLTTTDLEALSFYPPARAGQHKIQIQNEAVFALLNTYPPTASENVVWESHREYADIQVVVTGVEQMGIASLSDDSPIRGAYDAETDAAFYDLPGPDTASSKPAFLTFGPRMFAVYLPQDIHAPNLALPGHDASVRKVVVKVRLDQA